ncbi:MAG: RND family transporter [Dehalococcoidales bacterium]|nr:RND family transporter [Dehalococcoidales bacterium]
MMEKIADFIYRYSKLIIIAVVILNITALCSFYRFNFDTDFMSTFSEGNPKAEEYNRLNEKYQTGEPIQVLIESDTSLLTEDNLLGVFELQEKIAGIDGISLVQSLIPPDIAVGEQTVPVNAALIKANYRQLQDFIDTKYLMTDQFLSDDRDAGIIMVTLAEDASGEDVVDSLEELSGQFEQFDISLAGNEIIKTTLWDYLLRIILLIPPVIIILVLTVFSLMLSNVRMALLCMIPAGMGALWTFGTIFWTGENLSVVTVLTPMFIIIIGSAYGLHFNSHLLDNLSKYANDRRSLIVETLKRVGTPIFLATITTMAGFASLIWTDVVPMRQMGIYVTLGIGYAGLLAIFFLPAVLSRIKLPETSSSSSENRLTRFILAASNKRALIVTAFLVITIAAGIFIPRIDVISNQLMFFKDDSDIRQTFDKVEKHFGGAMPLTGEIGVANPLASLTNTEFAEGVLADERELEQIHGIDSVFSVFDLIKGINKMTTGQDAYPQNPALIQGLAAEMGTNQANWVSSDGLRMMVRTKDFTGEDQEELEAFVENNENITTVTGMPILFNEMNDLIVRSQIQSLGLALGIIFLMLWITLRRISAALIGLVPIVITITSIIGILAITGFDLNIMTATLSSVAVGIGIDYSIHILSSIYYYRDRGLDRIAAVKHALTTVSRPVMANALGLVAGYSALFFSPLKIHTHIGVVMWVAMLVSSLAALLLVPVFYSRRKSP